MKNRIPQIIFSLVFISCSETPSQPSPNEVVGPWLKDESPKETSPVASPLPKNELSPSPHPSLDRKEPAPLPDIKDYLLATTDRYCNDAEFGKGRLEACLVPMTKNSSRFDNLEIQFSVSRQRGTIESIHQELVEQNFYLIDQDEELIEGRIYWKDSRTLVFDPLTPLSNRSNYIIGIHSNQGDKNRPHSNKLRILHPFRLSLKTPARFNMSHSINDIAINNERGLILDQNHLGFEKLFLKSSLENSDLVKKVSLRKLGQQATITLCEGVCPKIFMVNLSDFNQLVPSPGLNTYIYDVESLSGALSSKHVSFNWGSLAINPEDTFPKGIKVSLDDKSSLKVITNLLSTFGNGAFKLDFLDENNTVFEAQSFNDIIAMNSRKYSEQIPSTCRQNASSEDFTYISDLGPFCSIRVEGSNPILGWLGSVDYKASADIYVTDMVLAENPDNLAINFAATDQSLDIAMNVKEYWGKLKIIVNISEAKYAGNFPISDALGNFLFETTFTLKGPPKKTIAKASMTNNDSLLNLKINDIETFNLDQSINGLPDSSSYFNTKEWHDHTSVQQPRLLDESRGIWTRLVNFIITQAVTDKVDDFKPGIVNGIARDMIQKVAPNALNTIVRQIKKGLTIPFPNFLPEPLNQAQASIQGSLTGAVSTSMGFIHTSLSGRLNIQAAEGSSRPPAPNGIESYIRLSPQGFEPPDPTVGPSLNDGGALLTADLDLLNQALFQIWQSGILNLKVDKSFVETIETFAVFDPVNSSNGKEILFAEFIPKLMGNKVERMIRKNDDGSLLTMGKKDRITIELTPLLPPVIATAIPKDFESADFYTPKLKLSFGDFLLRIKGHQDGTEYNIATLKMAVSSLSELKFLPYSNPFHSQQFSGVGAMSLHVLDDVESLDFAVEVYEDQNNNPFGINTKKLANAVEDMVDSLFIPLVNDALREFPLTGLRTCGIELDAARVQVLSIPSQGTPYLRFQAPLKSYDFSGTCNLKPDFDTPLPPLPPNPDPGPGTGGPNEPGPGDRILDMDFNQLPFTLGKTEPVPKIDEDCRSNIFFEVSCASASVQYKKNNQGDHILDDRGRKIYDFTAVTLTALVSKDRYDLRTGARDSVEGRFFDFESWDEYVADFEEHIVIHDSKKMSDIETEVGTFQRHYSDYETNSPKASGFIPIRAVTMHRILESPAEGAEVSTEFFANISNFVEVPPGRKNLSKAEGLDYQVGNIHLLDCGKVSWCGDAGQWLVIYDSKIRPADKSIPEDVLPYLKQALNSIMAGMFK